jgi:choline dehydrogenase-like flavoprotein
LYPGHGSSIHYAGTLPFSDMEKPYTLSPDGRVWGTNKIFVADGSGFAYLPAKGLTLSLMANAHRVAAGVLKTTA